ncbi:MAG: DUF6497 family protein [Paracoccaceae bacterium]
MRGGLGLVFGAALMAGPAWAGDRPPVPAVPSGIEVALQEAILDVKPDGMLTYARYRFVAPGIVGAGAPGFDARAADMQYLCDAYALPQVLNGPDTVDRISISLADRETEFGVADPEATQYFELYRIENGACIWEEF